MPFVRYAAVLAACALAAQEQPPTAPAAARPTIPKGFIVGSGTRLPLVMINSVSTKHAAEGDRVYLETSFPVLVDGRIVVPPGSYVAGTITTSKRAGRVKGRSELYLRFDSLTLPNGVTRDFRARMSGVDGRSPDSFDRNEGRIQGESTKGQDALKVGTAAAGGASVGAIAGSTVSRPGMGSGIGAAAGATAGLVGVLLTRGQDVVLGRGTVVEMMLDRDLEFTSQEIDFTSVPNLQRPAISSDGPAPKATTNRTILGLPQ